jgi:hypothetical protein
LKFIATKSFSKNGTKANDEKVAIEIDAIALNTAVTENKMLLSVFDNTVTGSKRLIFNDQFCLKKVEIIILLYVLTSEFVFEWVELVVPNSKNAYMSCVIALLLFVLKRKPIMDLSRSIRWSLELTKSVKNLRFKIPCNSRILKQFIR